MGGGLWRDTEVLGSEKNIQEMGPGSKVSSSQSKGW